MSVRAFVALWPLATGLLFASQAPAADGAAVDFADQIRPILENSCVACHGGDMQESGLRLDAAALILKGGDRGPAVVPGKSEESLLYQVLVGKGDAARMPADGDPLPADEIALIKQWIDAGAPVPQGEEPVAGEAMGSDHWAFRAVRRPAVPAVRNGEWVRNPIDAFVLARLESEGLGPSPEADRNTLIRRLSLDLRGLPPTPEELREFLEDDAPGAYERLVERMLASPHYGERWGRHWLDVARYADSNGFTIDSPRPIWKYRDWVIDALNRDLPFDRFVVEQLAGDLLPDRTTEQLVATGFHRNTLINEEGGTDPEQFRNEAVVDRVNTTGTAFLGLTVGCAQCHQHKYDPISQREYYELFAIFNTCDEPTIDVPSPEQTAELKRLDEAIAAAERPLKEYDAELLQGMPEWERQLLSMGTGEWTVLAPAELSSEKGSVLGPLDDHSVYVDFSIPPNDTFVVTAPAPLDRVTAVRLEALTHDGLPKRGPGRADNGNFVLNEFEVYAAPAEGGEPERVALAKAVADHSQDGHAVEKAIDGDAKTGWAINVRGGNLNVDREAVFTLAQPLEGVPGRTLTFKLRQEHSAAKYLLGRFRLSASGAPAELLSVPAPIRAIAAKAADQRTAAEKEQLEEAFKQADPARAPLVAKVVELRRQRKAVQDAVPRTMVLRERTEPRKTHIQIRGDFLRLGAEVQPNVPAVLPPLAVEGTPSRLDFARWLVRPDHPLTSRVTVNRFWQQFFGTGLVDTENDFGTQGSPPTHPELLDWLASELMGIADFGLRDAELKASNPKSEIRNPKSWSVKHLHRLIVTSATYRQSSVASPQLLERDPANRLLARQSRLRLEAEVVRDVSLAASGAFYPKVGGPSVYPPQPEGIYALTQQKKSWPEEKGPDRHRRGMYVFFWRSSPYPLLPTFDAPDANTACTRRPRSNTPLQALTVANDRAFFELAQGLALRVLREAEGDDESRLRHAFRTALSREPSAEESARLTEFLAGQRARFHSDAAAATAVATGGRPESVAVVDAAAWTAAARVILNLDEFITRE